MRFKPSLFLIALLLILTSCAQTNAKDPALNSPEKVRFLAEILEVHDTYLLITPNKGEWELKSADRIIVSMQEADLYDEAGTEIFESVFKEGMEVEIVYDGMIAESYPAQILTCYEICIAKSNDNH